MTALLPTRRPDRATTLREKAWMLAAGATAATIGGTALELRRRLSDGGADALMPSADLVRGVVARMTTPLLPDDYLHLLNPLWTARELRGKIVEVRPETDEAATIVIKPGWGWSFGHKPGQYVGIGVNIDGRWQWRSYSISSPSRSGHLFTITVKAMPEGKLSSHLVNGLEPGTIVRLALPQGEFVLPEPPPSKILFWTGGSGITPVMAMLRTLDRRGSMPDVIHVHSAPTESSMLFKEELMAMSERHPSMTFIGNADDVSGRFDLKRLQQEVPDWQDREAWVCGPAPMLDAAEKHWESKKIVAKLHLERFAAVLTSSGEGGHVTYALSGKEVDIDGATTLLEAGEAAGVDMPFGCRMGICHTCVVNLKKGIVKDMRTGAEYHEIQRVQTCVTAAAGDVTLEI